MFSGYTQDFIQKTLSLWSCHPVTKKKLHRVLDDLEYKEAGILYASKSMKKDLCDEVILRADTSS